MKTTAHAENNAQTVLAMQHMLFSSIMMVSGNLPSLSEIFCKGQITSKLYLHIWPTISAQPAIAISDDFKLCCVVGECLLICACSKILGLVTIQCSKMPKRQSYHGFLSNIDPSELPNLQTFRPVGVSFYIKLYLCMYENVNTTCVL